MGHPKDDDAFGDRTELASPELVARASKGAGVVVRSESQIPQKPAVPAPSTRPREAQPGASATKDVSIAGLLAPGARPRPPRGSVPGGPPTEAWTDDPWDRTSHAREGAALAKMIEARLARWTPSAGPVRRVTVQEPEERTGGGVRARLPISLVAEERRLGALVLGWLDTTTGRIELRPYATLYAAHLERFGEPWAATVDDYARLVRDLADFAQSRGLVIAQAAASAARAAEPATASAPSSAVPQWVWVAVGILLGVAATIAAVQL